ncbi:MAG: hypothetical protein VW625_06205, partial [Perlucidibaca sp.]
SSATKTPVLLLSGTTIDPFDQFGWSYIPVLESAGYPWCVSVAPEQNMGDIQVRGEYVVHAIRAMAARTGRKIAVIGHSQGGMVPRWVLRFWPDTRALVASVIAVSPSNHGTAFSSTLCTLLCPAALWQQKPDSRFITILNSSPETYAGISYSNIYSQFDEVIVPATSSELSSGAGRIANVAVQSVCPGRPVEHLATGSFDAVTLALMLDALAHDGLADPTRIDPAVCSQVTRPEVMTTNAPVDALNAGLNILISPLASPLLSAEPEPACYARPQGCDENP